MREDSVREDSCTRYHSNTNQRPLSRERGLQHEGELPRERGLMHSCTQCMIYLILPPLRVGYRSPCSEQSQVTFAKEISEHSLEFEGDSQCVISALKNS